MNTITITWKRLQQLCKSLVTALNGNGKYISGVWGIPKGGVPVATIIQPLLRNCPPLLEQPEPGCLIVDDIYDSGRTMDKYFKPEHMQAAVLVIRTQMERVQEDDGIHYATSVPDRNWVVFPWEMGQKEAGPEDAVVRLLEYIGEDVNRDGLKDTPSRVLRSLKEMTSGYSKTAEAALGKVFKETTDELVALTGVRFTSLCEHHILPFSGTATIAYLPGKQIVGVSKLARVLMVYAKRLQIQERLAQQTAGGIQAILNPQGVAVILRATHSCMACRGVVQPDAVMLSSCMLGKFREDPILRQELLSLEKQ